MHTSIPRRAVRGLSLLLALLLASGCLVLTACRTAPGDSASGTSGTGADTSADTESAAPDNTASTDTATGSGSDPAPETPGTEPVFLCRGRTVHRGAVPCADAARRIARKHHNPLHDERLGPDRSLDRIQSPAGHSCKSGYRPDRPRRLL
ncbi:MAG: hypothetical protein L6V84_05400 [Oscillospiraceae bacterium]|nr:MAG: hypothetical protein L6V84_05400 [Oscillospiraceae bacterium]